MSAGDQPGDVWNRDSGMAPDCEVEGGVAAPIDTQGPASYTHLMLPTCYSV